MRGFDLLVFGWCLFLVDLVGLGVVMGCENCVVLFVDVGGVRFGVLCPTGCVLFGLLLLLFALLWWFC